MEKLFMLLGKLEEIDSYGAYPTLSFYADGSGDILDGNKNVLFSFGDIGEAIDWLEERTKKEEYFDFRCEHTINFNDEKKPLYIAYREAIDGEDALRTLIVNPDYELEVINDFHKGKTGLKFKKKVK